MPERALGRRLLSGRRRSRQPEQLPPLRLATTNNRHPGVPPLRYFPLAVLATIAAIVLIAVLVVFPAPAAAAAAAEPRWKCGTQLPTATKPAIPLEVYAWREPADAPIARGWTHIGYYAPANFAHVACEDTHFAYFDAYEPRWHYLTFANDTPVTCAHAPSNVGACRLLNIDAGDG